MSITTRHRDRMSEALSREISSYQKRVFRVNWFARAVAVEPAAAPGTKVFMVIQDEPYTVLGVGATQLAAWSRAAQYVEGKGDGLHHS